tara:strand:- start:599 stop:838 length:240 start_codon:yes stop_codon:yes gene_type:complete
MQIEHYLIMRLTPQTAVMAVAVAAVAVEAVEAVATKAVVMIVAILVAPTQAQPEAFTIAIIRAVGVGSCHRGYRDMLLA